jgi:predicted nucleic acid-binding protein
VNLRLGASLLVSLFATDGHATLARAMMAHGTWSAVIVSEFAAAIARRMRMQELTAGEARAILSAFDAWVGAIRDQVTIPPAGVARADAMMRHLESSLRAPDAIQLVPTGRLGVTIATFDRGMAALAGALSIPVILP